MSPTGRRAVMLVACSAAIVSLFVILASAGSADTSAVAVFFFLVLLLGFAVLWGMGLYLSAKSRAWGWFLNDLLWPGIALPLHALFGPVNLPSASGASFTTSSPWQGGDGGSRWEYMQMSLALPPATTGMLMSVRLGTQAQAKAFFWNEISSSQLFTVFIQQQLQRYLDQGWQLVHPLGPANIQTRTRRKFTADVVQCILIALATFTVILIPVALYAELFHYRRVYEPSDFTISLQRTIGAPTRSEESSAQHETPKLPPALVPVDHSVAKNPTAPPVYHVPLPSPISSSRKTNTAIPVFGVVAFIGLILVAVVVIYSLAGSLFSSSQIANLTATATPVQLPTSTPLTTTFRVQANLKWQSTGVSANAGNRVEITYVSGAWTYSNGKTGPAVPPYDGVGPGYTCAKAIPASQCKEPVPDAPTGSLVGEIGSQVLKIGNHLSSIAEHSGILMLRMNDQDDYRSLSDNEGSLVVRISVT